MKSTFFAIYIVSSAFLLYLQSKGVIRALRNKKTGSEIAIKIGSLLGFALFISAMLVSVRSLMNTGFFIMLLFAGLDLIQIIRR